MEASPKLAFVLLALIAFNSNSENHAVVEELRSYALELAEKQDNGYLFKYSGTFFLGQPLKGEFKKASDGFEKAMEIYDPSIKIPPELTPSGDLKVAAVAWWIICLQIMGQLDQAKQLSEEHLALAGDYQESRTLNHVYTFPAVYKLEAREWKATEKILDEYLPIVREFGDPVFILTAEVYYYIAQGFQGDREAFEKSLALVNVCVDIGFMAFASTVSS